MRDGRIVQTGSPQALYDRPDSRYVADFVGSSNFFEGRVMRADGGAATVRLADGIEIEGTVASTPPAGTAVTASPRPEQIRMTRSQAEGARAASCGPTATRSPRARRTARRPMR